MSLDRSRTAIALLSLAGAAVAAYLVYTRYSGASIFCSTAGCETVQSSRYAILAGMPVAVLGLIGYAAILLTVLVPGPRSAALGVALSAVGMSFSAYLLYAQLGPIGAICQWCVTNDAVVSLVGVACFWRFLREQQLQLTRPAHR